MIVEIYKLQNDGSQQTIATCRLVGDQVVCEGDEATVAFMNEGIIDYADPHGKNVLPADGLVFLEQLKNNFKSGYLNASDILEN